MRRWVILDAMGVIYEVADDINKLLVPYVQERNESITAEAINKIYREASLGRLSSLEFWRELGLGEEYPEIEKHYLDTSYTLDPELKEVACLLKQHYSLGILSNDLSDWARYLRKRYDLDHLFNVVVISGDVGLRKPDQRIYKVLLDKIQSPPSSCIFVDDRPKNLKPAQQLGFKTIRLLREGATERNEGFPEITSMAELPRATEQPLNRSN